jgi:4-hydroxy-3-methylbut-2-en-1-yl diphosphate reductase
VDILLANPRGFCAGVDRAIHIVQTALKKHGAPVYVRHEIVHNKAVVSSLKEMGAVFIKEVAEVPDGATVIFSAHGVGKNVYKEAEKKSLNILDAACPLVKKVHLSAQKHDKVGTKVVLIGHIGHPEVEGHLGQTNSEMYLVGSSEDVEKLPMSKNDEVAYITQTTLSIDEAKTVIDALKNRFPNIKGPKSGDLCYATTNRQAAVTELSRESDILLIVGSANSSNSNRLRELGESIGIKSYLIDGPEDIVLNWFEKGNVVGISSGASAPEHLVKAVVEYLKKNFSVNSVKEITTMEESIKFSIPKELEDK